MLTSLLLRLTQVGAEWVLWVLVLLSFVSLALIVERCIYFYTHRLDAEKLAAKLQECLRAGDLRGAWQLVSDADTVEELVVAEGLKSLRRGAAVCSESMLSAKARLRPTLDARLTILATLGSNAPFIGLLGTVLGIVRAAHDLTQGGQGDPNAVMSGVFEALVATAVGLFVAIPAVVAFNLFQRRVRTTMAQVDSLAHLVLANAALPAAPPETRTRPQAAPPVAMRK